MFNPSHLGPGLTLASVILLTTSAGAATKYSVTELKPLPGFTRGAVGDTSYGLNNSGHSVGRMTNGPGGDRAAVWDSSGDATQLATPDAVWFSKADGVNSQGVISGDIGVGAVADTDTRRAVRWLTPTSYEFFLPDNGHFSTGDMINDNGWIGGIRYTVPADDATFQAYVWSPDGTTRWIDPAFAGGRVEWFGVNNANSFVGQQALIGDEDGVSFDAVVWTEAGGLVVLPGLDQLFRGATDINDNGIIIGGEYDGNVTDAAVWWDAQHNVHALSFLPGTTSSAPNAINNLGQIAGWTADTANCDGFADFTCRRATLWDLNGGVANLNDLIDPNLGDTLLFANGIDDRGDIYGEALNAAGERFLFLAQPVPEPSTWATVILGMLCVGGLLRRRPRSPFRPSPTIA